MVIVLTALIVSVVNVVMNSPSYLSACDDYYLEKILSGPVEQDDPILVEWVKRKFVPPSKYDYNIDYFLSGMVQEQTIQKNLIFSPSQEFILSKLEDIMGDEIEKGGVFLEAGAYDGEFLSNTLSLEVNYGWSGVLVEAHPKYFEKLLTKNRKSWAINACLNTKPWPSREVFLGTAEDSSTNHAVEGETNERMELNTNLASSGLAQFAQLSNETKISDRFTVQCLPLYTILKALDISHVDFFSLDVERAEMGILDTIPWDKITFAILAIEHATLDDIREYLRPKGYVHIDSFSHDHIFGNKKLATIAKDPAPTQSTGDAKVDNRGKLFQQGFINSKIKGKNLGASDTETSPEWKSFRKRRSKGIIRHQ